jgi:hypothetical protein
MYNEFTVNGLPLPKLLIELLQTGKWQHPGHDVIHKVIPFLGVPVMFLESAKHMQSESSGWAAEDEYSSNLFHEVRGSEIAAPVTLPWLDVEKAFFIAVNQEFGDDVAIALDYRTSVDDPRVVASEWQRGDQFVTFWREVTPTFSEFVERLGLQPQL